MIEEIKQLFDEYARWLRDQSVLREVGDWVEITTPYLDRHNDHLQIYARRDDGNLLLSDDSYTIEDLRLSGCDIDTPARSRLLQLALNGFGVQRDGDAITARATSETFGPRKHNLVQAMLAVNDLFYTAQPTVASIFAEDVAAWFNLSDIRYTERVRFAGKSGFEHQFDFAIPRSRERPERLVKAMNRPSRDNAQATAFAWIDVRDSRPNDTKVYAILNDEGGQISNDIVRALSTWGLNPIRWSQRDQHREELAA